MEAQTINVLLVEDDHDDYVLLKDLLSEVLHYRYRVTWESNWDSGLAALLTDKFDVCLIDYL